MTMQAKWSITELEQLKLLQNRKSATTDQFTTQNSRSSVECWDYCEKITTII